MFTSVGLVGVAILLAFVGLLVAALYAMCILGLAGVLGALVSETLSRKSEKPQVSILGLILTILGQTYASLAFVVFIVLSVRNWVGETTGFGKWIIWIVAFFVSVAPVKMALKDASAYWKENFEGASAGKITQFYAITFTVPITIIGFFVFVFFPSVTSFGWGWIPHF